MFEGMFEIFNICNLYLCLMFCIIYLSIMNYQQMLQSHYTHSHFLNGFLNISEVPLFKQKRVFVCDQDEEMELLIHESQHADENSERHDVEMFTPSLEKNKIMACQSMNGFIITYLVYY